MAGLAQKWGSSVTDTRKRVDNIVRVMGDCLDEGMPVAVQTLGVFVIMKYKESIVVDNKKRRMLVPPRMELCLFQQEQLPEIQAAEEGELADRLAAVLGEAPEAARAIVESFFHFLADAIDAELLVKVKGWVPSRLSPLRKHGISIRIRAKLSRKRRAVRCRIRPIRR